MKQLFLALLTVAGLAALAPKAEAGQYARVYDGYGVTYVPKACLYGDSYREAVCRSERRQRYLRSLACRPVYYREDGCRPVYRRSYEVYRAPRVAFTFGF